MSTGFYEEKGMARYTMILPREHKDKIAAVAKSFKISQGEVVEVLLEEMEVSMLRSRFEAKRNAKRSNKSSRREILEKMKGLTPEELKAVEETIVKLKGSNAQIQTSVEGEMA